jgi:hypothetical protein
MVYCSLMYFKVVYMCIHYIHCWVYCSLMYFKVVYIFIHYTIGCIVISCTLKFYTFLYIKLNWVCCSLMYFTWVLDPPKWLF